MKSLRIIGEMARASNTFRASSIQHIVGCDESETLTDQALTEPGEPDPQADFGKGSESKAVAAAAVAPTPLKASPPN